MIWGLPLSIQTPDHPFSYFWYSCNVESLRSPCCPPCGYCTPECHLIQRNGRLLHIQGAQSVVIDIVQYRILAGGKKEL